MKQMRENTKVILWIVVAAFVVTIFAVWGLDLQTHNITPQNQGLVGKVDDVPVTPQAYQSVYTQLAQQYRNSSPSGQMSAAQQEMLRDQAWDNIVTNILTEQEIKKLGITVSDEEVLSFLRNSPPPEVRQYFVDESGNFDYAAYQSALNNPDADWTAVEQLARQRIPLIKLNQYLLAQVHVGHDEIRGKFEEENIRMTASYVSFPIANEDAGDYKPSDEEVQAYYAAHDDDFREPEKAAIAYVRIPIQPTATDRSELAWLVDQIRDQLAAGEDFDDIARTYSEGPTAQTGGDVGFVRVDQRDPAIIMAASSLEPGAVSGPVWTPEGAFLIKLIEKRGKDAKTEYHLHEIELKLSAGPGTMDSLTTLAQDLRRGAEETTLESAAQQYGLKVQTTQPFTAGFPIDGVGFVPTVSRFAFAAEVGALSNVLSDDENFYVARVTERIPAAVAPLESVRDDIQAALVEDRRREMAMRKANSFFRSLKTAETPFAGAAEQYGLAVASTDTFSVRQRVAATIPPYSAFAYAALRAPKIFDREVSPPVESDGVVYVINVTWRSPFDPAKFQAQANGIRDRIYQRKVQDYIAWWYNDLRSNADIQDFRGAL